MSKEIIQSNQEVLRSRNLSDDNYEENTLNGNAKVYHSSFISLQDLNDSQTQRNTQEIDREYHENNTNNDNSLNRDIVVNNDNGLFSSEEDFVGNHPMDKRNIYIPNQSNNEDLSQNDDPVVKVSLNLDDIQEDSTPMIHRKSIRSLNERIENVSDSEKNSLTNNSLNLQTSQQNININSTLDTSSIHYNTPKQSKARISLDSLDQVSVLNSRVEQLENVVVHLNNQIQILKKLLLAQVNDSRKYLEEEIEDVRQAIIKQDKLYLERFISLEQNSQRKTTPVRSSPSGRKSIFSTYKSEQIRRQELLEQKRKQIDLKIQNESLLGEIQDPEESRDIHNKKSPRELSESKLISHSKSHVSETTSQISKTKSYRKVKRSESRRANSAPRVLTRSDLQAMGSVYGDRIKEQLIGDRLLHADDEKMSQDTKYVLDTYKEAIHKIFVHYCGSMMGFTKGKLTLSKMQFYKFLQDIELKRLVPDCNDELLWFKILRIANLASTNRRQDNLHKELSEEHMHEAIRFISKFIFRNSTMTEAQMVEATLISHIFPKVNDRIHNIAQESEIATQSVLEDLSEQQKKKITFLLKKHRLRLKESFTQCITTHNERPDLAIARKSMTSQQLIKFCQQYRILPLITKKELCNIHMIYASPTSSANILKISYNDFENVLIEIANNIYGIPPYSFTYKEVDQRLEKLFSKMFLLRD